MACEHFAHPGGVGIVCGVRRRKCPCGRRATLECDWKVPSRKSGTCDAPICDRCTTVPAPEKDLCVKHAAEWAARKVAR
jgi:hypothetical protein